MTACAYPDGTIHDHGNEHCHEASYQAGRRDALVDRSAFNSSPEPKRCTACRGRGQRLHGWAVCPSECDTCGGIGLLPTPPSLDTHVEQGGIVIKTPGATIRVEYDEVLPFLQNLLSHFDALGDAR